ncbi:MAG: sugar transferase [Verrucomicrobia bacterium]|nr:sugar transferase [Verrucomicrobiota bacterium]
MSGKRVFDIIFSSCVLFFGSPIFLFLLLLVQLTSKGPPVYKSLRMGKGGKLIKCWKFRTMVLNADAHLDAILKANPPLRTEWETFHKLKKDPRLTLVGGFLRKSSLDELPQFWNVLKGDLSVVGPRPIEVRFPQRAIEEIRERYRERTEKILSVKPGITCIWQTQGRNLLSFDERAALEERYVETRSFWLDLKIILKTIPAVIFPKGAY